MQAFYDKAYSRMSPSVLEQATPACLEHGIFSRDVRRADVEMGRVSVLEV